MAAKHQFTIGSAKDLHVGIHSPLLHVPPRGWKASLREADHVFISSDGKSWGRRSPFENFHRAEYLRFAGNAPVIHAYPYPVIGAKAWIGEIDDAAILTCGRFGCHPNAPGYFGANVPTERVRNIGERLRAILDAYEHPSCKRIFLLTEGHLKVFKQHIGAHLGTAAARKFAAKCEISHPACAAMAAAAFAAKWCRPRRLQVLFCGRNYDHKHGALALRAMRRLSKSESGRFLQFTFVGPIPSEDLKLAGKIPELRHFRLLPRNDVEWLMRDSHVLFHPARYEGFGMVFSEAAANGMAVIAARSEGLLHTDELFSHGGAILIRRKGVSEKRQEDRFCEALRILAEDFGAAKKLASENFDEAAGKRGKFSLARRNAALVGAYESCLAEPADEGFIPPFGLNGAGVFNDSALWRRYRASLNRTAGFSPAVRL